MPMVADTTYVIPEVSPQRLASAVQGYIPKDFGDARWELDMQIVPPGCPTIRGFNPDPCVEIAWSPAEGFDAALTWSAFRIDESVTCSTLGAWSQDELNAWALREGNQVYSAALARQVWAASFGGARSLASTATEVTTADTTPTGALAAVEYALGQRILGQGMVHMTVDMLTRLAAANAIRLINGQWLTASGNVVVADYGYFNADGASVYIYGSANVYYTTSGWRQQPTGWVAAHNDLVARVTASAMLWWDPCATVRAVTNVAAVQNNYGLS